MCNQIYKLGHAIQRILLRIQPFLVFPPFFIFYYIITNPIFDVYILMCLFILLWCAYPLFSFAVHLSLPFLLFFLM